MPNQSVGGGSTLIAGFPSLSIWSAYPDADMIKMLYHLRCTVTGWARVVKGGTVNLVAILEW